MAYIYSKQSYFKNSASECGDSHNLFPVEKINVKFIHLFSIGMISYLSNKILSGQQNQT